MTSGWLCDSALIAPWLKASEIGTTETILFKTWIEKWRDCAWNVWVNRNWYTLSFIMRATQLSEFSYFMVMSRHTHMVQIWRNIQLKSMSFHIFLLWSDLGWPQLNLYMLNSFIYKRDENRLRCGQNSSPNFTYDFHCRWSLHHAN